MDDSGVAELISLYWSREPAFCQQTVFLGHVASMTKLLLAKPEQCTETLFTIPPERYLFIYLSLLACFQTARLAGAGTEQQELTPSWGFEPPTFWLASPRLRGLDHSATCIP